MKSHALLFLIHCLWASLTLAGQYDPPTGYYDSATGNGSGLKTQLHELIDDHTVTSYNAARSLLQLTDQDPSDPDSILLVYSRVSLDVSELISSVGLPGWDSGASWNREHTWPRSRGVNSSGPDNTDLHQLRPADPSDNGSRSNLSFGGEYGQPYGRVLDHGTTVWYPGDADAGMIARQEMYMAVRYDGSDASTEDLELAVGDPATGPLLGDLSRLLEWHYLAPPDEFELRRNHLIYEDYQGNRNPFVDRPEYVWSIFVDQTNDSQIVFEGAEPSTDGSSIVHLDLGRVLIGATLPEQSVTLNKLGNDGTYFDVTTSGDVISSLAGRRNAFRTGSTDSLIFDITMETNIGTAGSRTGTVEIDNLDITTGAGSGLGANDNNDFLHVSVDVLDHALPSFSGSSELTTLDLDLGEVLQNSPFPRIDFDLFNLEATEGYTAGLQFEDILASGDSDAFVLGEPPLLIESGTSGIVTAELDTSTVGTFAASYLLNFLDEDLPGTLNSTSLTLTLSGEVVAPMNSSDFNEDGRIDGGDFLVWQTGTSPNPLSASDLTHWQASYGNRTASSVRSSVVPEPSAPTIMASLLLAVAGSARQRVSRPILLG